MKVFVDTSAWLAITDKSDQHHAEALTKSNLIRKQKVFLVTSDYVIDESITIIRRKVSHQAAVSFGDSLWHSGIVSIETATPEDRQKAWERFKKFRDKELSFTDCVSFTLMRKLRLQKAFTFDHDFLQLGFILF
jgi:uncharacterized protein